MTPGLRKLLDDIKRKADQWYDDYASQATGPDCEFLYHDFFDEWERMTVNMQYKLMQQFPDDRNAINEAYSSGYTRAADLLGYIRGLGQAEEKPCTDCKEEFGHPGNCNGCPHDSKGNKPMQTITLHLSDQVIGEIQTAYAVKGMAGTRYGTTDAFIGKLLKALKAGSTEETFQLKSEFNGPRTKASSK